MAVVGPYMESAPFPWRYQNLARNWLTDSRQGICGKPICGKPKGYNSGFQHSVRREADKRVRGFGLSSIAPAEHCASMRTQRVKYLILVWKKWWAWQGLNLRPLRCQHSALPLSYTPTRRSL